MERRVALTADAQRALAEGARLCREANLAIFTPEHLLAGALLVLRASGLEGLPEPAAVVSALELIHGIGEDIPPDDVTFGPGARSVLDAVAMETVQAGRDSIGAPELASGVVLSGETTPMFLTAMGTSRAELLSALTGAPRTLPS